MKTAAREVNSHVRWQLTNNTNACAIPDCLQPSGPTYLGLTICWKHYNHHVDGKNGFNLATYAEGEHSKLVLNPGLKWVATLELIDGEGTADTIVRGDKVTWDWRRKAVCGVVDSITSKDAKTVNITKKACPIKDAVVIWIMVGDKKVGLVAAEIVSLQESREKAEADVSMIDKMLEML